MRDPRAPDGRTHSPGCRRASPRRSGFVDAIPGRCLGSTSWFGTTSAGRPAARTRRGCGPIRKGGLPRQARRPAAAQLGAPSASSALLQTHGRRWEWVSCRGRTRGSRTRLGRASHLASGSWRFDRQTQHNPVSRLGEVSQGSRSGATLCHVDDQQSNRLFRRKTGLTPDETRRACVTSNSL